MNASSFVFRLYFQQYFFPSCHWWSRILIARGLSTSFKAFNMSDRRQQDGTRVGTHGNINNPILSKTHADRKFYDIPEDEYKHYKRKTTVFSPKSNVQQLLHYINDNILGSESSFKGSFGQRQVLYADYTASGKSLSFIEDFIRNEVLPLYGNTHTTTSVTSLQSTLFRHEARDIIRNSANASEHDAVIFVGSGCTGAVHKMINALHLQTPPVVFVSSYEHHSNLLPWKEIGSKVIRIKQTQRGQVDLEHLEVELKNHQNSHQQLIGSFSAASNVTGILTDVDTISILLHKYGALAFWDYAAAGPYVKIDMNPLVTGLDQGLVYKDAVFLSPHKFVGGPDSPGVLIAKKKLFVNPVPSGCGGGSVFFVSRESHRYLQEVEMREEGGTPSIVGAVRAGLAFQLKDAVTSEVIMKVEEEICKKVFSSWSAMPNLTILGNASAPRLPIFSFVIRHKMSGLLLHHNFICVLLNDLFGIQARGGCACAGPYAQDLLGIDEPLAHQYEDLLAEDRTLDRIHLRRYREYSEREVIRPGFARLNFPYFMSDEDIDFIINAVRIIAEEGWKLLPQYIFNPETGEWKHRTHQVFKDRRWLGSISYSSGQFSYVPREISSEPPKTRKDCLEEAKKIFANAEKAALRMPLGDQDIMFDENASKLRWFMLPSEAKSYLLRECNGLAKPMPFHPTNDFVLTESAIDDELSDMVQNTDNICHNILAKSEVLECKTETYISKNTEDINLMKSDENFISDAFSKCDLIPIANATCLHNVHKCDVRTFQNTLNECQSKDTCTSEFISVTAKRTDTKKIPFESFKSENNVCAIRQADSQKLNQGKMCRWYSPGKNIFAPFLKAVKNFNMIQDGDRILVCLSGGKDSLSLLHTLHQYQYYAKKKDVHFELGAVTVDPKSSAYDPSPLKGYLATLGVPYFYEEQGIMEQAASMPDGTSICSFCSRMKRGRIYYCAHREHYNVIALGQHLDDLAESFLMSLFHNGALRTMKAHYTVKTETLRVIRPFVFVREKNLRKFAESKKLPVISDNCPACFEAPKERHRIKQLLAAQEILFPRLFGSICSTLYPLMSINRTGVESHTLYWNTKVTSNSYQDTDDEDDMNF